MLRIHILNVGHGDSIVLEYHGEDNLVSFAVIDSNCKPDASPPALELLKTLGAESLSFVAITHPHADHYMGMQAILKHFSKNIDTLYTFPIRRESEYLKKIVTAYMKYSIDTDSESIRNKSKELAHILLLAKSSAKYWEDPSGTQNSLAARGFKGVAISTILPPALVKGDFFQSILDGSIEPEKEDMNHLSMAFLVEYAGHQIVLAGDGTYRNWQYQNKRWPNAGLKLSPIAVKLPHHGSKYDCNASVQNVIFGNIKEQQPNAIACISADGKSHPAPEVMDGLVRRGIRPYCTNLAARCGNTRQDNLESTETDPALLRLISSAIVDSEDNIRPCQGDIVLELSPGQPLKVETQYNNLCALRGDYDFMSNQIH